MSDWPREYEIKYGNLIAVGTFGLADSSFDHGFGRNKEKALYLEIMELFVNTDVGVEQVFLKDSGLLERIKNRLIEKACAESGIGKAVAS